MRGAAAVLLLACGALPLGAQSADPIYAIRGARIHTLAGPPIEAGVVVIQGGRIGGVGSGISIPEGAEVIEAEGLEVYPGMMDAVSRLGLTEIGAVRASVDVSEIGEINSQLRAVEAVHPASEHIPVARANGITHAVVAPLSGSGSNRSVIPGQASLVHLSGWTVEEMAIEPSVGMMLTWPTLETRRFDPSTFSTRDRPFEEVEEEYEQAVAELEEWLAAARHYARAVEAGTERVERDLKLEALARVAAGELPVLVVAEKERDIRNAAAFCERQGLRMILAGGAEAWKVKDLLKEEGIPVIFGPTQSLPVEEDDPYDRPFTQPGELRQEGIPIAFATFGASDSRTLPYETATAVAYGLPWEEGLKAITLYPAQILGLADRLGTIEAGKTANLIVTDGDPLEIRTHVHHVFIDGRKVDLDNKHRRLYETYRARP